MSGRSGQMSRAEYTVITDELIKRGPCKLLVFGCGNDSPVWHSLNRGGITVFIENDESWANTTSAKCQDCAIAVVSYVLDPA
jgi:glucuronoxylan 4-O-methyltransferase